MVKDAEKTDSGEYYCQVSKKKVSARRNGTDGRTKLSVEVVWIAPKNEWCR